MSSAPTESLPPELAVVADVQDWLDEAERLCDEGHNEMGVVRAVSALEVFLKRAFVAPYLRAGVFKDNAALGDLVVDALVGDSARWKQRLKPTIESLWGIDVSTMPCWQAVTNAWTARNKIVHAGLRCSGEDAQRHIEACRLFARGLLLARRQAGPRSQDA